MLIEHIPLTDDSQVTLTCYLQEPSCEMKSVARKPAVLILPGGGYFFVSDREAEPIALAYAAQGFQAFVLNYSTGEQALGCKPFEEASKALGLIRDNASHWNVIDNQVIAVGFSAGGHLAAWVGLKGQNKPDGMILGYPAVELIVTQTAVQPHNQVVEVLLGPGYQLADAATLNVTQYVTDQAIPLFCWTTAADTLTRPTPILDFVRAYAQAGRPCEFHMFQEGEHGLSLATHVTANGRRQAENQDVAQWFALSVAWIRRNFP